MSLQDLLGLTQINQKLDAISNQLKGINQQLANISMKLSELVPAITQMGDRLETAKAEILALLDQLRQADPDLTPEGAQALARLQNLVEALDNIGPDVPSEPTPEVERTSQFQIKRAGEPQSGEEQAHKSKGHETHKK